MCLYDRFPSRFGEGASVRGSERMRRHIFSKVLLSIFATSGTKPACRSRRMQRAVDDPAAEVAGTFAVAAKCHRGTSDLGDLFALTLSLL